MGTGLSSQQHRSNLPDVEVSYVENNYPPLKPPKTKKDIIFNPKQFTSIDDKAMVATRRVCTSYTGLLQYLTAGLHSDVQKARSIFVWLASQHIMYEAYDDVTDVHTPLGYMKLMQENRGSYEQFFALLCRGARIPCIVVQGHIKGAMYEVGDTNIESLAGQWTLAYLDGSWRIVHPKWAMVSIANFSNQRWQLMEKDGVMGKRSTAEALMAYVYTRDDFYFLTDPEDHIFRCLPKNTKYQLLEDPWTMDKFLNVPLLQNSFFTSGLKLPADTDGVLLAPGGSLEINVEVADDTVNLKYELYFEQRLKKKVRAQKQSSKYVFLNNMRNMRSFVVRFRAKGKYMLTILSEAEEPLCDFRIDCTGVQRGCKPFPKGPRVGWGFGDSAREAGLTNPSVEGGLVDVTKNKSVNFSFDVSKGTEVKASLVHNDITDGELNKHLREERTLEKYSVTVELPSTSWQSEYALEVHAKDKTSGEYKNVASYLLITEKSKLSKRNILPTQPVTNGEPASNNNSSPANANGSTVTSVTISNAETLDSKSVRMNGSSKKTGSISKRTVQVKSVFPLFTKPSKSESIKISSVAGQPRTVDDTLHSYPDGEPLPTGNGTVRSGYGKCQDIVDETTDKQASSTSRLAKNKTYSFKIKPNKISDCSQMQTLSGLDDSKNVNTSRDKLLPYNQTTTNPTNASEIKTHGSTRSSMTSPTKELVTEIDTNRTNNIQVVKDSYLNDSQDNRNSLAHSSSPIDNNTPSPRPSLRSSSLLLSPITPHSLQAECTTSGEAGNLSVSTVPVVLTARKSSTLDSRRTSKGGATPGLLGRKTSRAGVTPFSRKASTLNKDGNGVNVIRQTTGIGRLSKNKSTQQTKAKTASSTSDSYSAQKDKSKDEVMTKSPQLMSSKANSVMTTPSKSPTVEVICDDLTKAIESRRLSMINSVLDKSVSGNIAFHPKLTELKEKAESVRGIVRRLNKYLHEVMAVNQATIAEIHSYSRPKPVVHDVMRATFLLLGDRGAQLRTWNYVQQLMRRTSKDGLISRIQEFDIRTITIVLANYVKAILDRYDSDEVHVTSTGAGAFYAWCRNILKEVYEQSS